MTVRDPFSRPSRARIDRVPPSAKSTTVVAVGGAIGATMRFLLGSWFAPVTPPAFPWVTLMVNLSGAFLLSLIVTVLLEVWPPTRYARPFFGNGILGGYTTLSTFAVETVRLLQAHEVVTSFLYVLATLVGGLVAVTAGDGVVKAWMWARKGGR